MSLIALAMDLLLAVLLVATLGLGWRLEKRLRAVREGQAAFAGAVAELDAAAVRAQVGLAELRGATDEAIDLLGGRIVRAREAADRLDSAIARAELLPAAQPAAAEPRGLDALLARLEGSQLARPEPEEERPAARPARARPVMVDDDLFVDGGLA